VAASMRRRADVRACACADADGGSRPRGRLISLLGLLGALASTGGCTTFDGLIAQTGDELNAPVECTNKIRDRAEDGIDCGGTCRRCDGAVCAADTDCRSGTCTNGQCAAGRGKTCGVGRPNICADGDACQQDHDCTSDYCSGKCDVPPAGVHEDGWRNGGETGVDCGGSIKESKPCGGGEACTSDDDCMGLCNADKRCDAPSATDGKKNSDESDIDCGGPSAPKCAVGKVCRTNDDCELLACGNDACGVPTATDNVKNGSESDIDCGGPGVSGGGVSYMAPRCVDDKACTADGDCVTGACSPAGRCVAKSCDSPDTGGILTCGAGEVGDPAAVHENCCKSLPLPTLTKRRLDKYEITAGRFRTFLTAEGPDLRTWVTKYVAANKTSQLATMVTSFPTLLGLYPDVLKGTAHSLVAHMSLDMDNYGGSRGCYNGEGTFSANTYWQPQADLDEYGMKQRELPRETADSKSLNCVMPIMLVAFCAWDGGELATHADYLDAWGPTKFPWGADDLLRPNYNWCNGEPGTGGFTCQDPALGGNGRFYESPKNTSLANDMSPLIAAPGRFTRDATARKSGGESWMDLYANLAEFTGDIGTFGGPTADFCDFSAAPAAGATTCTRMGKDGTGTKYEGIPFSRLVGSTWEGHQYAIDQTPPPALQMTFQYGKFGGRCVRPTQ
jgi:hypothetical protein